MKIKFPFLLISLFVFNLSFSQKKKGKEPDERTRVEFEQTLINANKEQITGNPEKAFNLFEKCVRLRPDSETPYFKLAELCGLKKDYKNAGKFNAQALKIAPSNKWIHMQSAAIYAATGDFEKAAEAYLNVARLDPKNYDAYERAAEMYSLGAKYDQAIKVYDRLEKEIGINEDLILQKEKLYLVQNKTGKAIAEVQKLVDAYPGELRYLGMLAEIYASDNQLEKAFELYNKILEREPENGLAHFALSDYWREKGDQAKSFSELKKAFADQALELRLKVEVLGSYFSKMKGSDATQREEALLLAGILAKTHPNEGEAHELLADILAMDKQYEQAREEYKIAISLGNDKYKVWQQLIFCDAELKQFGKMMEDCDKALELFPNMPELYLYSCIAGLQQKQYKKVIASAQGGLELGLADVELQIQLLANMGDAAHFSGQYRLSDSSYNRALYLDGKNSYVLNNFAYFLSLRKEKLDKAEEMSKKTLEKEPDNATYLDTYGWILYQQKKYQEAKPFLEKAIQKDQSAEVMEHYGDLMFRLGKTDEAITYWKKAKDLHSNNPKIEQKIRERKIIE